jgi:cytochrome P450
VRKEAENVLGGRLPTVADVAQLRLTRMVIEESMRLYPPIWLTPRSLVADDEIGGFDIPRGSMVALVPYVTHRHPAVWQQPDAFDPERFAPERAAERPKGAYFPFLGGPHQCIGNEFAMLEMQMIVAMVLSRFDLDLVPGETVRAKASIVLRPEGPLRMVVKRVPHRLMTTTGGED